MPIGLSVLLASCVVGRRSTAGDEPARSLRSCAPPTVRTAWAWKTASLDGATTEIPVPFVERLDVNPRRRAWEYGPRSITLTLTTDPHTERSVPNFTGRCELTLGERSVEVVSSTNSDNDRLLTARVPNVEGGYDLIVEIVTRYPQEVNDLRRVITSVTVSDSARTTP